MMPVTMGLSWRSLWSVCVFLLVFNGMASAAQQDMAPDVQVRKMTENLVATLREHKLQIAHEPQVLGDLVLQQLLPHVDFVRMSRSVLGKYWRRASRAQKIAFIKVFREYLVASYATSMMDYIDAQFSVQSGPGFTAKDKRVVVKSEIKTQDVVVPVNYKMLRSKKGGWKIYDVSIEDISLVSNYRTTLTADVKKRGLDAVIALMQKKVSRVFEEKQGG